MNKDASAADYFRDYASRMSDAIGSLDWAPVEALAADLLRCWREKKQLFLIGNGGSAGNAVHLANDFVYALSKTRGSGVRATALAANPAVLTCLANDIGYEDIFSCQLELFAEPGDILLAFSGSGNSPNILRALDAAKALGVRSYAVLGYTGGKALALADVPIHVNVPDMQIAEDAQLVLGHMIVQYLHGFRDQVGAAG
jgi:D-sedoheptulose 7-phosphate isomerase